MSNRHIIAALLIFSAFNIFAFSRSIWVTSWDLTSEESIDNLIKDCQKNGIEEILAEVRYRGDALYWPNRKDSTFKNPEPRSYLLNGKEQLDPLQYLIKKANRTGIEIHAWVTVFVVTTHKVELLPEGHLFYTHPDWFTSDFKDEVMRPDSYEGAFLDPGVPEVHTYLLNVFLDIIRNYAIDGIHFDYIRYPDNIFGYNPIARTFYEYEFKYKDSDNWQLWKQNQISDFLKKISISIRNIAPDVTISAAVFPQLESAVFKYSQNWYEWLKKDYVDKVYLMAYTRSDEILKRLLNKVTNLGLNDRIVVGLRAWDDSKRYRTEDINSKIRFAKKRRFSGISLFSYSGIIANNYFKKLHY